MSNHLFIGLGGTGCAVVRELKKLLFCEWKRRGGLGPCPNLFDFKDRFGGADQQVKIATLSIDSNREDLNGKQDQWRVLGEEISLQDNEKVLLTPVGLNGVINNLREYPGIEPWVGEEREELGRIVVGSDQPVGCNQIRRMGRLALANGNNADNFLMALEDRRAALTQGGSAAMTIHISCSLAGGTGSGTLVDIITQIKMAHPEFSIVLYLFVTASKVGAVSAGNFYCNQYAALQELNALRLGIYCPWDIHLGSNQASRRVTVPDPFDSAFIISELTENDMTLTVPQQINSVAELVFQKLVRLMGNVPINLARSTTFENVAQYPADEPNGDRSTRFACLGVKRWAIPEEQIHAKLAYTFVCQGLARLLYNNWSGSDGEGYVDLEKAFGDDGFVEKAKPRWGITTDHLNCNTDKPDQANDPYPQFLHTWVTECESFGDEVKRTYPSHYNKWIAAFDEYAEGFFHDGFRGKGVNAYFDVRREPNALQTRAARLAADVEQDLISGMLNLNQDYLVHYFPSLVRRVISHLEIARDQFSRELKGLPEQIEKATNDRERAIGKLKKVGLVANWFGAAEKIFSTYVKAATDYYFLETTRIAAEYALRLIERTVTEFRKLEISAGKFAKMLRQIHEDRTNLAANLVIDGVTLNQGTAREVEYYIKPDDIRASVLKLKTHKGFQDAHAHNVVEMLRKLDTSRFGGRGFEAWIAMTNPEPDKRVGGRLVEEIDKVASIYSIEAHEQLRPVDQAFAPILRQNIVEKLYLDHGGMITPQLEAKVRELMESAMPSVKFDGATVPLGHSGVVSPIFGRTVFLPECDAVDPAFRNGLRDLIQTMVGGGRGGAAIAVEVADVPAGRNCSEIMFLAVAYFFPLRMLKTVKSLHDMHSERMKSAHAAATFQVYSESHNPALPSLLRLDEAGLRNAALPWVLLAEILKLIHVPKETDDGASPPLKIATSRLVGDHILLENVVPLTDLTCSSRDRADLSAIHAEVGHVSLGFLCIARRYATDFRMRSINPIETMVRQAMTEHKTKAAKDQLKKDLVGLHDAVFSMRGGNQEDNDYKYFADGVARATKLLDTL